MGELFLSDTDPAAAGSVCEPGEWPDDLTEGSEFCSASVSCCEAVAGKKKIKTRTKQEFNAWHGTS